MLGALMKILLAAGSWESLWWVRRLDDRKTLYDRALAHARAIGVPLIVVGAPDRGATSHEQCLETGPPLLRQMVTCWWRGIRRSPCWVRVAGFSRGSAALGADV